MKYATTFGSSTIKPHEKEYQEAIEIGKFLAQKGYIVKCGGYQGLMEAISIGVKEAKGTCIGITLQAFNERRPKNENLTKEIVTQNLHDRVKLLVEDSELFVIQKGSLGTLNELFCVWAIKYASLGDFRICMVGKEWESLKKCDLIDTSLLKFLEFYKDAEDFIKNF
ncbi:MAG: LOG family protein [Epsilonproteobacteria bacterium]|nr:LOG family protein [Campylobacterota bacterium]